MQRKAIVLAQATLVLVLAFQSRSALSADLTLVADGKSDYEIMLVKGGTRTARFAARELQSHLEKSTSVKLDIVTSPTEAKHHVFVGPSQFAAKLGVTPDGLPPESLRVKTVGRDIVILGADTRGKATPITRSLPVQAGTLYGVYEFLERVLGIRWYGDDDLYTIVSKHKTLVVPRLDVTQSPSFAYRALPYSPQGALVGVLGRRWRLGQSIGTAHGHNWYRILPVEKYGKEHPEYFALVNGERQARYYLGHHGGQVCTTHPDVVRIFAEAAIQYFRTHKNRNMFSLSPNDGGGFCQCAKCRALDVEMHEDAKRKGIPVMTDRMLTFYNAIAERVAGEFPDRYLGAYVYSYYKRPPKRVKKVHPNLALVIAINSAQGCATPDQWQRDRTLISGWTKIHKNMFMYDIFYLTRWSGGMIHPIHGHAVERIRFFHETGIRGAYLYVYPSWETGGPTAYLMGKLLWNADADVDRLQREFYRDMYGAGARQVRAYYDLSEESWRKALAGTATGSPAAEYYANQGDRHARIGTVMRAVEPVIEKGGPLLAEAALRIKDPMTARRFERLRQHHELGVLTIKGLQAAAAIEVSADPPPDALAALSQAVQKREALLKDMKAYAPYLVQSLRDSEDSLRSPLRPAAAHFIIAQTAGRTKIIASRASITVDGDDADWKGAAFSTFKENMGAKDLRAHTEAAVAFDDKTVYVCLRCEEPEKPVAASCPRDSAQLFNDDNVEVFLDANRDRASYLHFAVNAAAARYDGRTVKGGRPDAAWNGDWTAAVRQADKRWTVEFAIPFTTLGVGAPRAGDKWGMELCRTRRCVQPNEYQSLAPTLGGYHQPDRYADLIFVKELPR